MTDDKKIELEKLQERMLRASKAINEILEKEVVNLTVEHKITIVPKQ